MCIVRALLPAPSQLRLPVTCRSICTLRVAFTLLSLVMQLLRIVSRVYTRASLTGCKLEVAKYVTASPGSCYEHFADIELK